MGTTTAATTLRTNLADHPNTRAIRDGRVTSGIVTLDICGPEQAHNGFKAMLRENRFDCGELAIVTCLQAKAYGKPFVLLPVPVSGPFQHHCAGFNEELVATLQGVDMPKDPRVKFLVPDPHRAAKAWFAREGVVPINHIFAVHEEISRKQPEVVRELYRMLLEGRALAEGGLPDPFPPVGLEANRKGIELAIDWALDQKIIPHRMSVDSLFDDTTASLGA